MVNEITFKVRECTNCQAKAVSLAGIGADCENCDTGEYRDWTDTKTVQISGTAYDELKDHAEAVGNSD